MSLIPPSLIIAAVEQNDVSHHNIMLNDAGRAILIDFDSARPIGARVGHKSGTKGYMRPATDDKAHPASVDCSPNLVGSSSAVDGSSPSENNRIVSTHVDYYALDKLADYLNGIKNPKALNGEREWRMALWKSYLRSGFRTQKEYDSMKRRHGYDDED